jgi:hypothetical protein
MDGKAILAHDQSVERMVRGGPHGEVTWRYGEQTAHALQQLEIPYREHLLPPFPPEGFAPGNLAWAQPAADAAAGGAAGVPTEAAGDDRRAAYHALLEEVLLWVQQQERPFILQIECKEREVVEPVDDALTRAGRSGGDIVFSGDQVCVERIRAVLGDRNGGTGARTVSRPALRGANIRTLTQYWADRLAPLGLDAVDLNPERTTRDDVRRLTDAGLFVLANLADAPDWWRAIELYGFHALKTNFPEEYTRWWLGRAEGGTHHG